MNGKRAMTIQRRHVLIAGAALAAAASGAAWIAIRSEHPSEWIEAVVRKHLPGVPLDPATLQSFAERMANEAEFRARKVALALRLDKATSSLVRLAPEVEGKIGELERLVLSAYLSSSNFFRVRDPRAETIYCVDDTPLCGNPFAVFRNE